MIFIKYPHVAAWEKLFLKIDLERVERESAKILY